MSLQYALSSCVSTAVRTHKTNAMFHDKVIFWFKTPIMFSYKTFINFKQLENLWDFRKFHMSAEFDFASNISHFKDQLAGVLMIKKELSLSSMKKKEIC